MSTEIRLFSGCALRCYVILTSYIKCLHSFCQVWKKETYSYHGTNIIRRIRGSSLQVSQGGDNYPFINRGSEKKKAL